MTNTNIFLKKKTEQKMASLQAKMELYNIGLKLEVMLEDTEDGIFHNINFGNIPKIESKMLERLIIYYCKLLKNK